MDQTRRLTLVAGLLFILFGAFFLAVQIVPGFDVWLDLAYWWPLVVVAPGVLLFLLALVIQVPALAVPGSIVTGIGALLFWQNATGNWDSWAYAWTLILGFNGIGLILTGLLSGKLRKSLSAGLWLIAISMVSFAVFASLLGGPALPGTIVPSVVIALGVLMLVKAVSRAGTANR